MHKDYMYKRRMRYSEVRMVSSMYGLCYLKVIQCGMAVVILMILLLILFATVYTQIF